MNHKPNEVWLLFADETDSMDLTNYISLSGEVSKATDGYPFKGRFHMDNTFKANALIRLAVIARRFKINTLYKLCIKRLVNKHVNLVEDID